MTPLPLVQYFWQFAGALQAPLLMPCVIVIAECFPFASNMCLKLKQD